MKFIILFKFTLSIGIPMLIFISIVDLSKQQSFLTKITSRKEKYFMIFRVFRGAVLVVWDTDVLVEPVFLLVVVVLVIVLGVFAVRVWSPVRVRVAGCGDPQVVLPGTCLRLAQRTAVILHSKAQLYQVYILSSSNTSRISPLSSVFLTLTQCMGYGSFTLTEMDSGADSDSDSKPDG